MTGLSSTITITFMSFFILFFLFQDDDVHNASMSFASRVFQDDKKRMEKKKKEKEKSLEFPLFHLFKFLLITSCKKKNGIAHVQQRKKEEEEIFVAS